jgi:hypothetical protein
MHGEPLFGSADDPPWLRAQLDDCGRIGKAKAKKNPRLAPSRGFEKGK